MIDNQALRTLVEHALEPLNIELVDMEVRGKTDNTILRIFVDEPGGISIDRCSEASRAISDYLDRKDPIPSRYVLEVSSPGVYRPLKTAQDFNRQQNHKVWVSYRQDDEIKEYEGRILTANDDKLYLQVDGRELLLYLSNIVKAKIIVEFK
jgi:ribosome maturation factor RimP